MRRLTAGLLGLALVLGGPSLAAGAEENHYIAVIGSGKAEQWPDYAVVTGTVWKVEKSTGEAAVKATEILQALRADLNEMGIPDERIEFRQPNIERKTERVQQSDGGYKEVTVGFEAIQQIVVTVKNIEQVGNVITLLTNGGAQISLGVKFEVNDPDELRVRARTLAIADARRKAEDYATGSKRRLGRLLVVEESRIGYYRLHPSLRRGITGEGADRIQPPLMDRSPSRSVLVTPQPVTSNVTLYVKFALQ